MNVVKLTLIVVKNSYKIQNFTPYTMLTKLKLHGESLRGTRHFKRSSSWGHSSGDFFEGGLMEFMVHYNDIDNWVYCRYHNELFSCDLSTLKNKAIPVVYIERTYIKILLCNTSTWIFLSFI